MGNEFMTVDIGVAAALRVVGHELLRGELIDNGKMRFYFRYNENIKNDSELYHLNKLHGPFHRFREELKTLKSYVYEKKRV